MINDSEFLAIPSSRGSRHDSARLPDWLRRIDRTGSRAATYASAALALQAGATPLSCAARARSSTYCVPRNRWRTRRRSCPPRGRPAGEGLVLKERQSPYRPRLRSLDWLKVKHRQTLVVHLEAGDPSSCAGAIGVGPCADAHVSTPADPSLHANRWDGAGVPARYRRTPNWRARRAALLGLPPEWAAAASGILELDADWITRPSRRTSTWSGSGGLCPSRERISPLRDRVPSWLGRWRQEGSRVAKSHRHCRIVACEARA